MIVKPPARRFVNDLLEPAQSFNQSREHVRDLLVARPIGPGNTPGRSSLTWSMVAR